MKFAVVSAWPEVKNAEYECIERIKLSATNIGSECIVVDNEGNIVDSKGKQTGTFLNGNEVEFIIALHFTTPKLFDCYMYGAMWNPPKFLVDWDYNLEASKYFTYDDYLVYGSKKITDHLDNLLSTTNKNIDDAIHFVPSVPGKPLEPNLPKRPKLFYSGINWEKIGNKKGRHDDLFRSLDRMDLTNIYGPEKFMGAIPWENFKTYKGSLPFDGISAIKVINECGVSLVITSDTHRDAEAATNRLYESCAAGAIIISDNNPFVEREFGDSVLYFEHDHSDYMENVHQIKKHLDWISNNKDDALKLAHKSQKIYRDKFMLDDGLKNLISKHNDRQKDVNRLTLDVETEVSVIARCISNVSAKGLVISLESLSNQINLSKVELIVVCDLNMKSKISSAVEDIFGVDFKITYVGLNLYKDNIRVITKGEMISEALSYVKNEYVSILDEGRKFFNDHLSLLLKQFADDTSMVNTGYVSEEVIDPTVSKKTSIKREKLFFDAHINNADIMLDRHIEISALMFRTVILKRIPKSRYRMLDEYVTHALLIKCMECGEFSFSYKNTLSIVIKNGKNIYADYECIVDAEWQKRVIRDGLFYRSVGSEVTTPTSIDQANIDKDQLEVVLKSLTRYKLSKYPRILRLLKKIYRLFK